MNSSQLIKVSDYMAEFIFKSDKNVFMLSGTGSIHLDDAFAHQKEFSTSVRDMKQLQP